MVSTRPKTSLFTNACKKEYNKERYKDTKNNLQYRVSKIDLTLMNIQLEYCITVSAKP